MRNVIIGEGGFGREVAEYLRRLGLSPTMTTSYAYEPTDGDAVLVAIGDPKIRKKVVDGLDMWRNKGWHYFSLACLDFGPVFTGEGAIICPGTQITVNVRIEEHVIINLNCTVGHDSTIGRFTTLSPGVHVSGNVTIGEGCYIGSGAVIREGVRICDGVTIGAGAVVVKNINEAGTYIGVPAKKIG